MVDVVVGIICALILLTGLSIYSALRLAKKTDDLVKVVSKDEYDCPILVSFPERVFARNARMEAIARQTKERSITGRSAQAEHQR